MSDATNNNDTRRRQIEALMPVFARASVGDFSGTIEIPDVDDEMTDLYVGVQLMLEVIRGQLGELRELNGRLEETIAARTSALAGAQALAHIGNWEWDCAADRLSWSDELHRIYGRVPGDTPAAIGDYIGLMNPADREIAWRLFEGARGGSAPFDFHHRFTHPSGVERMVHVRGELVPGAQGRVRGTGQDVSESYATERALRRSEERYRRLVDSARDVIFTISPAGIITSLNPAFESVTGWPRDRWVGRSYTALLHPDDLPSSVERFKRLLAGEAPPLHQWRMATAAGSYIVGEVTSTPRIEGGRVVSILGIARDITERKRLQDRIDEIAARRTEELRMFATHIQGVQEEERRRIARELHDDLGQRLTGMRFALEELEDAGKKPRGRSGAARVRALKKQIDAMIADIRRTSSHLHPSALDDLGLTSAMRLLCAEFGRSSKLKVRFVMKDLPREPYDPGIEIALYRIAQEALANCARHANAKNAMVRLGQEPGKLLLTIEDDGRGFDMGILDKKDGDGRGLGLISMKERAETLGGLFSIVARPGEGTLVRAEIPVKR